MTQRPTGPEEETTQRAASLLADALNELQQASIARSGELATWASLEALSHRIEQQLNEEKEQRAILAIQLGGLTSSVDGLANHLQGLTVLMGDLLERFAIPAPLFAATPSSAAEQQPFQSGGEGVSLILQGVPSFQALMDIQKALMSFDKVAGVSVERYQEGDSRLLLQLAAPVTARELAYSLRNATGHAFAVEESRAELAWLRLRYG